MTKNVNLDKHKSSDCDTGFDAYGNFFLSNGSGFRRYNIWCWYLASYKGILIFDKGSVDSLYYTSLTAEKESSINFTVQ